MIAASDKLQPYSGKWSRVQIYTLLRRTIIGFTVADAAFFEGKSMNECLNLLLTITIPAPPINNMNGPAFTDTRVPLGHTWINDTEKLDGTSEYLREENFRAWWTGAILRHDRTITERLTLFWHNHFVTEARVVNDARYSYKHIHLLRTNGLGNLKKLVKQVTQSPAMLVYLNGNVNVKGNPNENYGRELQELFTLGKGPDSQYTEDDVKAAARVMTGWKDGGDTIKGEFHPEDHDTSDKKFSAFYDHKIIKGRPGPDGERETDELIDLIFSRKETARFFCRKLYRWFVHYNINDSVEKEIIIPLADMLTENNFEVKPVLRTLLASEHFYSASLVGGMIKSPIEFNLGCIKQFKVPLPSEKDYMRLLYKCWLELQRYTGYKLHQFVADPPNVAGWPAYYQSPAFYNIWMNADTLMVRNSFTDIISSKDGAPLDREQISGIRYVLKIHFAKFAEDFPNPGNADQLVADSLAFLCPVDIGQAKTLSLKNTLNPDNPAGDSWAVLWGKYKATPADKAVLEEVEGRLRKMYPGLMKTAQYQMM